VVFWWVKSKFEVIHGYVSKNFTCKKVKKVATYGSKPPAGKKQGY
jgi:hypothetical protein